MINELGCDTFPHKGERTVVEALLAVLCNGQRGENGESGDDKLHIENVA
jgi:hypothetical protein